MLDAVNNRLERVNCLNDFTKVSIPIIFAIGLILTVLGAYYNFKPLLFGGLGCDIILIILIIVKKTCSYHEQATKNIPSTSKEVVAADQKTSKKSEPMTFQSNSVGVVVTDQKPLGQPEPLISQTISAARQNEFIEISTSCSLPPHITFIIVNLLRNSQEVPPRLINYFENMPVGLFIKMHAYGINDAGSFHAITNCNTVGEARIVLLGETHAIKADFDLRERVIHTLLASGDTIWLEGDPKLITAQQLAPYYINKNVLVEEVQYAIWDTRPDQLPHGTYLYKLGLIFQRILEVHKGTPYQNDSFDMIEIGIKDLTQKCLDHVHIPIIDAKARANFLEKISKVIENEKELRKRNVNREEILLIRLISVGKALIEFLDEDSAASIPKMHKSRQDSLVNSILQDRRQQKNRGFFIGGRNHFLDRSKNHEIEGILGAFLNSSPELKYIIIHRIKNDLPTEQNEPYTDFRTKRALWCLHKTSHLLSKFIEEASQILETKMKALLPS